MKIAKPYQNHPSNNSHLIQAGIWSKEKWPALREQTIDQHLTIGSKAKNPSRDKVIS